MAISRSVFKASPVAAGRKAARGVVSCQAFHGANQSSGASMRRLVLGAGLATVLVSVPLVKEVQAAWLIPGLGKTAETSGRQGEVKHSDEEWEQILGEDAFRVMRQEATERPFSSPLNNEKRQGTFVCAGCGNPLFPASTKYNSGTGWPSFYDAIPGSVDEKLDLSISFMPRTEIRCHRCQGHLGHVFDDGPRPTGLRYCMNGLALKFVPEEATSA